MNVSAADIKLLREQTGAGILDCRKALEENGGDMDKAMRFLREKGLADAEKRAGRETGNGRLELYDHGDGRVGVMVEVNCETDFVARSEEFRNFAHEIALQIAASAPEFIRVEEIPEGTINLKQKLAYEQALEDGKPDNVAEKIAEGRLKKYIQEVVLLEQEYIRDEDLSIEQLLLQTVAALGENVIVRRFARWELGESSAS